MTENTNGTAKVWKEADNSVDISGTLVENKLELREFDTYENGVPSGKKREAIAGEIVIRTKENENHSIRLRQNKITNAGKENGLYKGLVTIMNETVSIADTESNPDAKPSRLSVRGDLRLNEYYGNDDSLRSFPSVNGVFVNRLPEDDTTENKAEFDVEGMVGKVLDEFDREGEETGRKKVTLLIPLYNSVIPVEFMVDAGQGADYIEQNFENGASVRIYGEMVNFRKVTVKEEEMGFGEARKVESVEFVNELLIKGGSLYDPDVQPSKIIDPELVKGKLVEREKHLENLKTRAKERAQQGTNKPKTGFGSASTPSPVGKTPLDGAGSNVDLSNLF